MRATTACQKPPKDYAEAISRYVLFTAQLRQKLKTPQLIAMDETAVWFDPPETTCVETRGVREV